MIIFLRQLSALMGGGVPLARCLEATCEQNDDPRFREVLVDVSKKVNSGFTLSNAMGQYPLVFSDLLIVMIRIGEQTGQLESSLERLGGWLERDHQIAQRLRSALSYPLFIAGLAGTLALMLFYTVVPSFAAVFEDMDAELPLITRVVIGITQAIRNPGFWMLTLAGVAMLYKYYLRAREQPAQRRFFYGVVLKVPLLGAILHYGSLARFCSAMDALLSSGLDLMRTVRLSAAASQNPMLIFDSEALVNAIQEGDLISSHMGVRPDIYEPTLVHLFVAGEEASKLPEMLAKAGEIYDAEMNYKVDALGAALEPLMLCIVAGVVGTVILSVFLPLYSCLNKLA